MDFDYVRKEKNRFKAAWKEWLFVERLLRKAPPSKYVRSLSMNRLSL
jgi:hypothetical protein